MVVAAKPWYSLCFQPLRYGDSLWHGICYQKRLIALSNEEPLDRLESFVRTKLSNTAHQQNCSTESQSLRASSDLTLPVMEGRRIVQRSHPTGVAARALQPGAEFTRCLSGATADEDEGLLHDAGNLIGAIGLYCDLLAIDGVLRPEHSHYAEELRLLSTRSAAMIERLMELRIGVARVAPFSSVHAGQRSGAHAATSALSGYISTERAEGLRSAVARCAGLLRLIADEHAVEIAYGDAAALPVCIPAESVERILINLVRNAVAAFEGKRGSIRVGVGLLPGDSGGVPRPWPFQRVRLIVEDSGRGMAPEEVRQLLEDRAPLAARHGIGFRVVRELVEMSGGGLLIVSTIGRGTRVEMEWPVAQLSEGRATGIEAVPQAGDRRRAAWQS